MTAPAFPELWPLLSATTQTWLIDHNGEPLDPDVLAELVQASPGEASPLWLDTDAEDGPALSDATVDWIEAVANDE